MLETVRLGFNVAELCFPRFFYFYYHFAWYSVAVVGGGCGGVAIIYLVLLSVCVSMKSHIRHIL